MNQSNAEFRLQLINPETYLIQNYFEPLQIFKRSMLCLNCQDQTFNMIDGSKIRTFKYESSKFLTWHLLLVQGSVTSTSKVKGIFKQDSFLNKMPIGYTDIFHNEDPTDIVVYSIRSDLIICSIYIIMAPIFI